MSKVAGFTKPVMLLLCQSFTHCTPEPAIHSFPLEVLVESDVGVPLAGARVSRDSQEQGVTGQDGKLRLTVRGTEGSSMALRVQCPEDYASPEAAMPVTLRSFASAATVPRYRAACPPFVRKLVVAVRAQQGPHLPIMYRGREVARTDAAGAAHVLLKVPPKDQVTLTLDTASDARLRPKSPELSLEMSAQDKLVLFDKSFTREEPPTIKKAAPAKPKRHIPQPVVSL